MASDPSLPVAHVGVIGAGDISARYVTAMRDTSLLVPRLIASARGRSAEAQAAESGLTAVSVDALLADPGIDLVLNLAPPLAHGALTRRALEAGKHVYSEKPLAGSVSEAEALIALAADRGLMLACAPATTLGPALQTARAVVDAGELGKIVGARATMVYPGPDLWHHNPDHLFGPLAGPLFDMGVYHLTALVALLGPVAHVTASASRSSDRRMIRAGPRAGEQFPVTVPTHVEAGLLLASGIRASALFSFDGFGSKAPGLELFGTRGSLAIAHPSRFEGPVEVSTSLFAWRPAPAAVESWSDAMWAIGPAEAWAAFCEARAPRTDAGFACHLLEVLAGIEAAATSDERIVIRTRTERPAPLTMNYKAAPWWPASDRRDARE